MLIPTLEQRRAVRDVACLSGLDSGRRQGGSLAGRRKSVGFHPSPPEAAPYPRLCWERRSSQGGAWTGALCLERAAEYFVLKAIPREEVGVQKT